MKNLSFVLISLLIVSLLFSCKNKANDESSDKVKQAETLDELINKYDGKEFKDCDEFLAASNEMIDVYLAAIDKAYEGDAKAKDDLENFDTFFNQFDEQADQFSIDCPEKFDKWAENTDKRVAEATEKLMVIFYNEYERLEWDEETIEKELEMQLEQLNEELKQALQEETDSLII